MLKEKGFSLLSFFILIRAVLSVCMCMTQEKYSVIATSRNNREAVVREIDHSSDNQVCRYNKFYG